MTSALIGFDAQKTFTQSIEIEDIGNCALRCTDTDFNEYYICAQTVMGKTYMLKFGPLTADITALANNFDLGYKVIDYKEQLIERELNLLINDAKKKINNLEIIDLNDLLQMIPTADKFIPE